MRLNLKEDGVSTSPNAQPKHQKDVLDALLEEAMSKPRRFKAPKADLKELARAGLIRNGEKLFLVDYRGSRVQQVEASVADGLLEFKGKHFSMSDLARELLKKVGFESDSVRGPAHWVNGKGVSVMQLWQQVLERRAKK